jgi:HAD superfamily hydrolase (TIGR01509 family)
MESFLFSLREKGSGDEAMSFGAIFDWDGVIIDSSRYHKESWELLAREAGRILPPDHFQKGFGMKNATIIRDLLGWTADPAELARLGARKEELYRDIAARRGIELLPGVLPFLRMLRAQRVPCVVGSSTPRQNIQFIFDLLHIADCFDQVVASEDVSLGKPDPEVFLKAAQAAGCPPERCVVFEDALVGIEAARRGRMRVVAVATTNPPDRLTHADRVVRRLDELTVQDLIALTSCG